MTRQHWLGLLANSPATRLAELLQPHLPAPTAISWLRHAQTGLVMLQGRSGGSGSRFNLGEISVSRASCQIGGLLGHGWVRGSDGTHAELIAQADALLQDPQHAPVLQQVLQTLQQELSARRAQRARETAASKVEFFTMVRGE